MPGRLDGKVALVTGGARGIGRACANALAAEGATVGILDRSVDVAQEVCSAIEARGGKAAAFAGDVSKKADVFAAVRAMREKHGRFDVIVNNAMWVRYGPVQELTEDALDRMVGTGFKSVVFGIQAAAEAMENGGSVVNIASAAAFKGLPRAMAYCGVKAGVLGLSRSAAVDLGKLQIRVNCVCPGSVPTEGVGINVDPEVVKSRIAKTPRGRLTAAEEVAKAVVFLASDDSVAVTGESILVDGGATQAFL
ncbi:hypothetical protein DFJ74DRAFT_679764 [Hyaloraphidium curvatum]|nr:hypothetical protein DFJ74DRAFT_679764 [Hyaloraphidium curvatum]